ncbi:MAG: outer membrane lipid asymmetry maintenance protein MlaD [Alphaproteobacteria bacterium]|nr:outer membrane lipid asymmetry maintenance protein MlaD [Alphaproteobacteria bacterium]
MKRSLIETILGAAVLFIAGAFLLYSYKAGGVATPEGYEVSADFSGIGGLQAGDDVQISGVKVGAVTLVELVPDSFLARVHMSIAPSLQLPTDTAALISSQSLLGGRYLALEPGGDEETIPNGGRIAYTQAPQNLEQLLGQFIFSMKDGKDQKKDKVNESDGDEIHEPAPAQEPEISTPEE